MAALELRAVVKRHGEGEVPVVALDTVDLAIEAGEFVAIVGPSGSGKSTLLNLAAGFDEPTSGSVLVADTDLASMSSKERSQFRRRTLGFVFQAFHLLPELTVSENVALPLTADRRTDWPKVAALLDAVGLASRTRHRPAQLSGGEQQRVAIARALVNDPVLVLADEPTGNLDSEAGAAVLELLADRASSANAALVVVTHDLTVAGRADRVVRLRDGVVEQPLAATDA